jgi:hypothetical protein
MNQKNRLNINLPGDVLRRLRRVSQAEGRTQTVIVQRALALYFAQAQDKPEARPRTKSVEP